MRWPPWPAAAALLAGAALWLWAAHALWSSTPLPSLDLPHLDPHRYFGDSFLHRSSTYQRFLAIEGLLGSIVVVAVLAVYARRGARLVRESAAGRVGTGMLLAMLGFAVVWLAEVPFDLVALWWQRRYGVSHQAYLTHLLDSFLSLGSEFVFVCVAFGIAMGLAGVLRRWWWLAAVPALVALALLFSFLSPYLLPDTEPVQSPTLQAEARALERIEGAPQARLRVQNVHRFTDAPNAEALGLGPSRTIVLWDTLMRDDFDRREVRFVLAHEVGHLAHDDPLKLLGWLTLFLLPAWGLVAFFTRRRGGLHRPEAVPVALLVLVTFQLLAAPVLNVVTRRVEASADWAALQATHEPSTDRAVMRRLALKSLADPDPPAWAYVLYENHPTIMQRIALAQAWEGAGREPSPRAGRR
ncbi:MAG TPA: M48 family metalloprotease [Solirubrobacterales bacterium]|nr:M48 family metalloprotease [Solirubrobacterales bacterium]